MKSTFIWASTKYAAPNIPFGLVPMLMRAPGAVTANGPYEDVWLPGNDGSPGPVLATPRARLVPSNPAFAFRQIYFVHGQTILHFMSSRLLEISANSSSLANHLPDLL